MTAGDMTEGRGLPGLWRYAVPLILGSCFQLAYNAVDSIIVGRFIGKGALAAEGIASPVMNLVILGISGVYIGAGVLMSEFFGAKAYDRLKREMSTAMLFGLLLSILVAVAGIVLTQPLLDCLHVPKNVRGMTSVYLRITFLGAPFTCFYNALAAALKSIGDSSTPLKFLMFSSILNGVLDLLLIGGLGFGIVCSAVTTVVAQAVSAGLCVVYIFRRIPLLHLRPEEWRIDGGLLRTTLRYGSITALQQSVQPICKLLIQGQVNLLGLDAVAAFHACTRVDDFAFTPEQSISHAITTFIAQNRGAKKSGRIRKGFRVGLGLELIYWVCIAGITLLFRRNIMGLFVDGDGSGTVIELGSRYLQWMALFYVLPALTNGMQGFYRGVGKMGMTLLGTTIQASVRVLVTYLLAPRMGISGIAVACAVGWTAMLCVHVPYYFRFIQSANK